ncbi:MAG: hypothetical protein ACNA8L_02740 [Luteolibacter sp.]
MTKPILILIAAVIVGFGTFAITRLHHSSNTPTTLLDELPELAWLRKELALTDEQFARIGELHAAYRPICEEMCDRISASLEHLEQIALHTRSTDAELKEAIENHERVRAECKTRMLEHLYQTASLMNDEQSARYLKAVLPAALGSSGVDHSHH